MKKETKESLIIIAVFLIVGGVFSYFIATAITDAWCKEGIVTDKYILQDLRGMPNYYLVIDNESDVRTNENSYYKYNVGDYYNQCTR